MKDWTAPELLQLSGAYWTCCAVQAGVQLDLFTALAEGPVEEAELARRLECDGRALNMLATALVALGFLERQGAAVAASPSALTYLSRTSSEYIGFIIRHHAHIMPGWTKLAEAVRTGASVSGRDRAIRTEDEGEREAFLMGMFNVARQQADAIAKALDLSGRSRLIDVGGGPGTYAVYFCLNNPALQATIFDLPTSERFALGVVERYGLTERISFAGGDFLEGALPKGQDVAWLSQVLHGEGPAGAARLIRNAAACLNPGGLLCIQEFAVNNERTGPAHPALFSLNMLVGTEQGQAYTEHDIRVMMEDAGAKNVHPLDIVLPGGCKILLGTV